jgi:uncharacterized protein (AIM24 family)
MRELQAGQKLVCRRETFLVAENSVHIELFLQKSLGTGFFGGQGFMLQQVTGPGRVFLDLSGEIVTRQLGSGERLRVHPGHIGAQDSSVSVDFETLPGIKNAFFGAGLFVAVLTGPGEVMLQSMPVEMLAAEINHFLPHNPTVEAAGTGGVLGSIIGSVLNRD